MAELAGDRLSSPRRRRRLVWVAAAAGVAAVVAIVVAVLPASKQHPAAPARGGAPAQVAVTRHYHLTAADRRAIDAALDRFVPEAVARKDPAAAWDLAGPELRSDSSRAAWRAGNLPVPSYPAKGSSFHYWNTIDVGRDEVIFNILVHPTRDSGLGDYTFSGQMVKRQGRWLVNRLYTIAINNPVRGSQHEIGPDDFSAQPASSPTPAGKPFLGKIGILPVVALLALILLIPISLGVLALFRARRWRRHVRARGDTSLPPLPSSYLPRPERDRRTPTSRR